MFIVYFRRSSPSNQTKRNFHFLSQPRVPIERTTMEELIKTKSKALSAMSLFSFIPSRRNEPKERRYFNSCPEETEKHLYDSVFRRAEGYDMKLHRDDRTHAKSRGLNIHLEESSRPAPVLSSSVYGRRLPLPTYESGRRFARVSHVHTEFYRKNGISKSVEEGYGTVFPV